MKKLFTFLFIGSMIASCSNDEVNEINEPETAADLETQVAEGLYDNSNLGIYEGVFTTLDGQLRATVLIEIDGKSEPAASFFMQSGDVKAVKADKTSKSSTESIHFSGEDFSFDFSVEENGSDPVVSNVTYMGKEGDVMIIKETSKAPVSPRTGTYWCLDCDTHPDLGAGKSQTFNAILVGGIDNPESDWEFQFTLGSDIFYGSAEQSNCDGAFGLTTCEVDGQGSGDSGPFYITGSHTYFSGNDTDSCSRIEGNIVYDSKFDNLDSELSFETDGPVGEDGNCP
ncbi:hypothetical protein RM549_00945 [Salegentibacter sp. F188]|uniref:Lipoprotein n=1 Tax=Autumnicola patrickiae TaxID=3075591 RepID=A0ABU3DXG1_9FLAO|nr:hypothetical protein [Salegentibacter sp. F188]MDT0688333.1 hypothetical protein [Salegentibacter sp. F188]